MTDRASGPYAGPPAGPYAEDLALALRIAEAADAVTLDRFGAVDLAVESKPDHTPVSDADRGVERLVRDMLRAERPSDAVLGEEYGLAGSGPRRWVVDPVDGTKNFVRGVPVWATLIALMADAGTPSQADPLGNGTAVVGVVSAPALGCRWWAARGSGAWAYGPGRSARRLAVSRVARMDDAFLGYSGVGSWHHAGRGAGFEALTRAVWRTRGFGDFWSHVLVAEGAIDVSAEPEVNLWDLAALQVVVEEAGGRLTDLAGRARPDGGTVLCSNGALHAEALRLLGG